MPKRRQLLSLLLLGFLASGSLAQEVTTLVKNRLINDGLFVDADGTIYSGCGGLAGRTSVGVIRVDEAVTSLPNKFAGSIDVVRVGDQLAVTNYDDNSIKVYDFKTNAVRQVTKNLDGPSGIELHAGRLYVANWGAPPNYAGHRISIIDAKTFELIAEIDDPRLFRPQGIVAIGDDRLVVANTVNGRLFLLDTTTQKLSELTTLGLNTVNLAFDGSLIYSANNKSHQIVVTDLAGRFMTLSGDGQPETRDGSLAKARFLNPLGVALSADGKSLYVSQAKDGALRKISLPETRINPAQVFKTRGIGLTPEGIHVPASVATVTFHQMGSSDNEIREVAVQRGLINKDAIPFEQWSISFVSDGKVFGFSNTTSS